MYLKFYNINYACQNQSFIVNVALQLHIRNQTKEDKIQLACWTPPPSIILGSRQRESASSDVNFCVVNTANFMFLLYTLCQEKKRPKCFL